MPKKKSGGKKKTTAKKKSTSKKKTAGKKKVLSEHYGKSIRKTHYDSTERYPRSVWKVSSDKQKNKGLHPCLKPLELIERIIKTYSNEGMVVLDFCMGANTTGKACKKLKRYFIGIEKDVKHFETAVNRVKF